MAHQFPSPEDRDVAIDVSRDATSVGLAGGGSARMDLSKGKSHLLVGERREALRYLLVKKIVDENVFEQATMKNRNRQRTIGVALTKRR